MRAFEQRVRRFLVMEIRPPHQRAVGENPEIHVFPNAVFFCAGLVPAVLRPKSGAGVSWRASMMPRRIARVLGEKVEQRVAIAPADGLLQAGQVLGEAAEDFEHRLLVVHEDVAPHGRVGSGDAGEIAKARGREFDDLLLGDALQVVDRAHDIVGDKVRHMRGDGQHEVVMRLRP